MNYIPDPLELMQSRIERLEEMYVDESTCMECRKVVNYDLYCMSPLGDGPAVCAECAGIKHSEEG
jgi:hypothetical protein